MKVKIDSTGTLIVPLVRTSVSVPAPAPEPAPIAAPLPPPAIAPTDVIDGQWVPEPWDDGGGPDAFEIEIGNRVAYSVALWEGGRAFADLRKRWLPYYRETLREQRLRMVHDACLLNIERVHFAITRDLMFYGFDRLYHAFQEFLQLLFIAHRVYPIAYNKWIREQVEGLLGLGALYPELLSVLAVSRLERDELIDKAEHVRRLLRTWASPMVAG